MPLWYVKIKLTITVFFQTQPLLLVCSIRFIDFRYTPYAYTEVFKEALERNPVASVVARGTRVLARRDEDGYYYVAHIAQDVTVSTSYKYNLRMML